MKEVRLDPVNVDASTASFRLGPRINAAGRLARADAALELLMTDDKKRAAEIASELNSFNHERREAQQRAAGEAEALCATQMDAAVIVVAAEGWHPGVVGIVASKLVERYHRPCAVIALDGDTGRGSARSIPGYDLHEGLAAVSEHLTRHGGHRMAAGFELEAENVDAFRGALAAHAGERLTPRELLATQDVDVVVPAGALTLDLAEELERLGPFGASNPEPVLVVPGARIEHVTAMGSEDQHARFSLAAGGARARGVAFRVSQRALAEAGGEEQDVIVALECSRWNGTVEPRVVLRAVSPMRSGAVEDLCPETELYEGVELELAADPAAWWPAELAGASPSQPLRDRRGEGVAGLTGDLLSSGESVLLVVADVPRRVQTLERIIAGQARGTLPVMSWEAMGEDAFAASGFAHIVVLDPPPVEEGLAVLGAASGDGLVHLAWGPPEREFALACWRERLSLRPALIDLWRALDNAGELVGDMLVEALRGHGAHPRASAHCGRMVRVLCELGLAGWDVSERGGPVLRRGSGARTDLEESYAYRAYAARLADAERYLTGVGMDAAAAAG
jgi:single-stranded-DNA-specific exonuclease